MIKGIIGVIILGVIFVVLFNAVLYSATHDDLYNWICGEKKKGEQDE